MHQQNVPHVVLPLPPDHNGENQLWLLGVVLAVMSNRPVDMPVRLLAIDLPKHWPSIGSLSPSMYEAMYDEASHALGLTTPQPRNYPPHGLWGISHTKAENTGRYLFLRCDVG